MSEENIPERYRHSVIPHIMIDGAAEAIEFYSEAFNATEIFRISQPNGIVVHAEIEIGNSLVMIGDAVKPFKSPKELESTTTGLHVYVEDVDTFSKQAINFGAEELQPVQEMFYGARQAMLKDPYGHIWIVLTHTEDLSPKEIEKNAQELFEK